MAWEVSALYLIKSLLLAPGINLILFIVGIATLKKYCATSYFIMLISVISLLILSTPRMANHLTQQIEPASAISAAQLKKLKNEETPLRAIVVLSGGRVSISPEYGNIDTVSAITLQRIQYASWLQKKTGLPVLLSGGSQQNEATSEAVLMNQVMMASFGVAPKWIESNSKNTLENAQYAADILHKAEINEIVLVTHAWHMQRAKAAFQNYELKVISAATGFQPRNNKEYRWHQYLPNAEALQKSNRAIIEVLGKYYYQW